MIPALKAELVRQLNRAGGCYNTRLFHTLDQVSDQFESSPDEVAELLEDIQPGAGYVYRQWRAG